ILFGQGEDGTIEELPRYEIYVAHRTASGAFAMRRLDFKALSRRPQLASLRNVLRLNLSPDANYLLTNYSADSLPSRWEGQPFVRYIAGFGTLTETYVLGLYDIKMGSLRLGFDFPAGLIHTSWAEDSRSYSVVGPSPFGTEDAKAEAEAAAESGDMLTFMNRQCCPVKS